MNKTEANEVIYHLIKDKVQFIDRLNELKVEEERVDEELAQVRDRIHRIEQEIQGVDQEVLRWHTIKTGGDSFVSAYTVEVPEVGRTYYVEVVSRDVRRKDPIRTGRVTATETEVLP